MPSASDPAAALLALGAATLGESGGHPMRARIAPAWPGARVAGPAFPARCTPGDNLAIHVAVARAPAGSVVVVDVGIERELGYFGEVLTTAAEARGLIGLVIDGGVRDVAALEAHHFPVFATGVALKGATKTLPGAIGTQVEVGDVPVHPGDWIVGDADGVTVVPRDRLEDVLTAGRARADNEARLFGELQRGATTIDLLGLDPSPIEGA
ncbi:MAG: dimethylmenaquinone methyltransferase [Actinobacteria bacterium]|nr:dimethylmenaquinone methyltransferase [Actinomycetota bacterium]